jgi:hypothetical protein
LTFRRIECLCEAGGAEIPDGVAVIDLEAMK